MLFWLPARDNRADLRITVTRAHSLWWGRGIWWRHRPQSYSPSHSISIDHWVGRLGCGVPVSIQGLFLHAGVEVVVVGHGAIEVHQARLVSIRMLNLGLCRTGCCRVGTGWVRRGREAGFRAAIRVVEHGVTSAKNHIHTVTHGDGFQHFYYFFMGQTQHTWVINVHQDVRWERERHFCHLYLYMREIKNKSDSHFVSTSTKGGHMRNQNVFNLVSLKEFSVQ